MHFFAIRYAEFSKACDERSLQNKIPPVTYYGLFRDDVKHRKVAGDLESAVFSHWDQSSAAPAKHRPRPPVSFAADAQMLALFGPNRWEQISRLFT